jgi:hypothetical protein
MFATEVYRHDLFVNTANSSKNFTHRVSTELVVAVNETNPFCPRSGGSYTSRGANPHVLSKSDDSESRVENVDQHVLRSVVRCIINYNNFDVISIRQKNTLDCPTQGCPSIERRNNDGECYRLRWIRHGSFLAERTPPSLLPREPTRCTILDSRTFQFR